MTRLATRRPKRSVSERYPIDRSPFAQNPSQRDIATLVSETRDDLRQLATPRFKNTFIIRRTIETNGKQRKLVYPEGRLRAVHERLKFHLSKIVQPSYLMSPRKGRTQRENAEAHVASLQYLTLDLRQFYPSTTRVMIRNALMDQFHMRADVAGLIAHLATVDDIACFGSPLTPVLATLVHRRMFDAIHDVCVSESLAYSVWVDDLTISGSRVSGAVLRSVRDIISRNGLRSHKLKYQTGNRPVFITGVGVVGRELIVPNRMELKSKELWEEFQAAASVDEIDATASRLLAHLGGIRHVVGTRSERGKKVSGEMNSVRQKRMKALQQHQKTLIRPPSRNLTEKRLSSAVKKSLPSRSNSQESSVV